MFHLSLLSGKMAGRFIPVRHFPFRVGRATQNDLILDDPGVWAEHLEFTREENLCALNAVETASVAVNGESTRQVVLRNGDQIEFGGVKLRFELAPLQLLGLRAREVAIWLAVVAVFLFQFWLIYWLLA